MRYFDYVKRSVPMHDDLYDLFLQELPGYDMVGYRDTNLVNWGSFDDPDYVDYSYANITEWGRKRYITPGIAINGELITTDLVEINLAIRILLGSSYFDSWENERTFVTGTRSATGRQEPSLEQGHAAKPQKRDFKDKYTWVMSPRPSTTSGPTRTCCDTGGGPFARQVVHRQAGLGWTSATRRPPARASRWRCRALRASPRWRWSGRCRRSRTRSSAIAHAPITRPTRPGSPSTTWSAR